MSQLIMPDGTSAAFHVAMGMIGEFIAEGHTELEVTEYAQQLGLTLAFDTEEELAAAAAYVERLQARLIVSS